MHIILFEDQQVPQMFPATIARPAFAVNAGTYRLIDLARRFADNVEVIVRPYLKEIVRHDEPKLWTAVVNPAADSKAPVRDSVILVLNARVVPDAGIFTALMDYVRSGNSGVIHTPSGIACALFNEDRATPALKNGELGASQLAGIIEDAHLPPLDISIPMFEYAHDIIRHHLRIIGGNLNDRLRNTPHYEIADGVFLTEKNSSGIFVKGNGISGALPAVHSAVAASAVFDVSEGPVVFEDGVKVGPFCYFKGPVYVSANARINAYTAIKDAVFVGNTAKIGGEVEGSVIEAFTNKQHHGFLGHSYLGSWINLGAGTSNSDLKNTYGEVVMDCNRQRVKTGMQFVGCIVGDYAKTAINTSIFTGKTIGACSFCYGFVTTNVASFVNYARTFGQVTEVGVETMEHTQARMFARRNVKQRPCDVQLLRDIYEMTRHERMLANEPLQL